MRVEGTDASLIRAGAAAVAQWRSENPNKTLSAEYATLTDLDLSGVNLSRANFLGATFMRCDLRHVNFSGATLIKTKFNNCVLDNADFRGAKLNDAKILAASLDGGKFGNDRSIGRITKFEIIKRPTSHIHVDRSAIPWFYAWLSWDRLRFLSTIRIFVPAYVSLTLTVLYLNGVVWYNATVALINNQIRRADENLVIPILPELTPTWTHILVLANFLCLAAAATSFLACPARVVEFSREKWLTEFQQPEILYDHATWQRPFVRCLCAGALLLGGLLSCFLLGRAIAQQTVFIIRHVG